MTDLPQGGDLARRRAHMPEGTGTILAARSLPSDHRRLAEILEPGLSVLDVGCGGGAITAGIARAVGPDGRVVGIDVNPGFIEDARHRFNDIPGLSFETGDIHTAPFRDAFDIVTAARVVQWLADPLAALRAMVAAARPGGRVIVLDYNHEKLRWVPEPPASVQAFYAAFLHWRAEAGMDNTIADRLAQLFAQAGAVDVVVTPQHETTRRGEAAFESRISIWAEVMASRGHQMVDDGMITEPARQVAETEYRDWVRDAAQSQTMYVLAVEGARPR